MGGIILSGNDIDYLKVEISPVLRAASVTDIAEMQWALDIITLSNARRWNNEQLFEAKRDSCIEKIKQLPMTLQIIKQQESLILECISPTFWEDASEEKLDAVIDKLGGLMKHRDPSKPAFRVLDLKDDVRVRTWLDIGGKFVPKTTYQEMVAEFISGLADRSEAVRKIRDGEMVTKSEIADLVILFDDCEHPISVDNLREAWGAKRVSLEEFLAYILRGEELPDWETKVRGEFESFIQAQSTFNTRQIEMLNALCTYVIDNEAVAKPALVKAPFTQFDRQGFPGVFKMDQINEILSFTEALTA